MQSDTLTSLIKNACRQFSGKTAIQFYRKGFLETRLTDTQLDRETSQTANCFLSLGGKQERPGYPADGNVLNRSFS